MDQYKNFLGGRWADALGGVTFEDLNPANRSEVLGVFPRSDHRDVDRAVETAKAYAPTWSAVPVERRAVLLDRAAVMLHEQREEVARLLTRDTGKLLAESDVELDDAIALLHAIATDGRQLTGSLSGSLSQGLRCSMPMPRGVGGVITDWSFSLAGALSRIAALLVTGNTVVFKPAEEAPLVATRLLDILLNAGVAPEAISLVHGQSEEAGAPLVRQPDVDVISFAGSADEAREVSIACAAERRSFWADIGERFAAIVLDDADLDRAVPVLVRAATCCAGQRWRGPTWILTQRKISKDMTEQLIKRLEALRLGDGLLAETEVGPLINDGAVKRLHGYTRLATKEGARLHAGGEAFREGDSRRGFFYLPTLFGDVIPKMRVIRQESAVGLLMLLTSFASLEDALAHLNGIRTPRTAVVFTRSPERIQRTMEGMRHGRLFINPTDESPDARPWARFAERFWASTPVAELAEWKHLSVGPVSAASAGAETR